MSKIALMAGAGLGFRVHSGWAVAVAVSGDLLSPAVVDRRRLELSDHAIAGSVQPYHAARGLQLKEAEKLITRYSVSTHALANQALQRIVDDLSAKGYRAVGSCVLLGSGRALGSLGSTLASHALIHTAEGEFFRHAIRQGSEACLLPVVAIKEKEIREHALSQLRLPLSAIDQHIAGLGKSIGPPWRQDEKLAALGAWLVLAQ